MLSIEGACKGQQEGVSAFLEGMVRRVAGERVRGWSGTVEGDCGVEFTTAPCDVRLVLTCIGRKQPSSCMAVSTACRGGLQFGPYSLLVSCVQQWLCIVLSAAVYLLYTSQYSPVACVAGQQWCWPGQDWGGA